METTIQDSLLPFIPLLYIAWADGILEKEEIVFIEKQIQNNDELKAETKNIICKWLNPNQPPSARELAYWKNYIKKNADVFNKSEKLDLFTISSELAKRDSDDDLVNEKTKNSLLEIEKYLGIQSQEFLRSVLEPKITSSEDLLEKQATKSYSKDLKALLQYGNE